MFKCRCLSVQNVDDVTVMIQPSLHVWKAHGNGIVDSALIYHNDITTLGPSSHFPFIPFEAKGYSWGKGVIQVVGKRMRMSCFEVDINSFQMYFRGLLWLCILDVHQNQIPSTILLELSAANTAFDYVLQDKSLFFCVFNLLQSYLHLQNWSHSILIPWCLQL